MKYATTVVYVGTQFFRQFLENSRSHRTQLTQFPRKVKWGPSELREV